MESIIRGSRTVDRSRFAWFVGFSSLLFVGISVFELVLGRGRPPTDPTMAITYHPPARARARVRFGSGHVARGRGPAPAPYLAGWPKVVLLGDSLTEFAFSARGQWGAILTDRLRRRADVVPRGFAGYNSRLLRAFLPDVVPSFGDVAAVAAVTLLMGTNDADARGSGNPRIAVPVEEYADNLRWIARYLDSQGIGKDRIIFISPPPTASSTAGPNSRETSSFPAIRAAAAAGRATSITSTSTRAHASACIAVAKALDCAFVDLFNILDILERGVGRNWDDLLDDDGVHLAPNGSRVLADALWPLVENRIRRFPRALPNTRIAYAADAETLRAEWARNSSRVGGSQLSDCC